MGDRNCVARAARDRVGGETEKALSMEMARLRGNLLQQRFGAGEVCEVLWLGGRRLRGVEEGGWPVVAPSAVPFRPDEPDPISLDSRGIETIVAAFEAATRRALKARVQAHRDPRRARLPAA